MNARTVLASVPLVFLVAAACGPAARETPPVTPVTPVPPPPPPPSASAPPGPPSRAVSLASVGLDASAMDRSVEPCNDFYQFACGGWLAKTEIPADKSRWSRGFDTITDGNERELRAILEDAAAGKSTDPVAKKIGAFYGACMDEKAIEANGTKPIDPLRALVRRVHDPKSLAAALGELHKNRIFPVFDVSEDQDAKDATKMIAALDQAGLGLPDRDYYFKDDDKSKEIRAKYAETITKMLTLAGYRGKAAAQATEDVLAIETELAKVSKTRVERRDPSGMYNRLDRKGLEAKAPDFPWDKYFDALGAGSLAEISVTSVPFFEGMNKLLTSQKPTAWQHYLDWHVIHESAGALPKAFVDLAFELHKTLTGQAQQRDRWKRCVSATDASLGELLAQAFVERKFGKDQKQAVEGMVYGIRDAFADEVATLDWMDAKTKEASLAKLKAMSYLIGFPKTWRAYDFEVDPKRYGQSLLAARRADTKWHLAQIGKPVDREQWLMTPPTVNAYYNPSKNQMVFPAGILQPPFYGAKASLAVNLGAMGMVVGHELTHGFDDQGSQYDGNGNLQSWWTPDVRARFDAKGGCVVEQYGAYEPLAGVKLNGKLTLGENIADIGGVKLAFHAYKKLRAGATEVDVAEGFTEDQQFFLSVGQVWCSSMKEAESRRRAQVDPHSSPKFRVNGSLSDTSEFAQAFSCKQGAPMRPEHACSVW